MKYILMISLWGISTALTGCVSTLSGLNRRPYSDQMSFVAFTDKGLAAAKPIGKRSVYACTRRFNYILVWGDEPQYNQLKKEALEVENIKYMTNVKSLEVGESGFILGKTCIGFEGEAYQ